MSDENVRRFRQTLALHCAPSMAGIKPADLISWKGCPSETTALLATLRCELETSGITLRPLCRRGDRCLVLVFRPDRLAAQLARPEVRSPLLRDGYPVDAGLVGMLDHLGTRLAGPGEFPHEVGLFLGYPAADVEGFRVHQGRDPLYSGLWKVYSDVAGAKKTFARCRRCRTALSRRVADGCSLAEIFSGAGGARRDARVSPGNLAEDPPP